MHNLAHLGFKLHPPCPQLQPHIRCYWTMQAPADPHPTQAEFMHPEGGCGVIFNFADALLFDGQPYHSPCLLTGPTRQTTRLHITGQVDALGVRFNPGKGMALFGLPLSDVLDIQASALDIIPSFPGLALAERLAPLSIAQRIKRLDQELLHLLSMDLGAQQTFTYALTRIQQSNGSQNIQAMTQDMNISQRQLERQFGRWLGLSPKQYSKLQRIQLARQLIKAAGPASLTELALQAGYYDQAHFIHEFKQVVGLTPGQYLKRKRNA
ncbi:helix-turn-helix domain-containing protein [Bowmanella denitrificans]|uniref:helix-turn-helix domain-containing protein n=1 Tax=Bowmanella denitrificans TaxID=366582 RepID=UPI000C9A7F39